ncbi:MAG TPA: Na+/H+ antiporter NhaC family protein [Candidatus Ozemobacteraceae bacterium]|nr:Na+/H+ antiporter NhaC family protein [Candidatus Ozemobacteraceae bacterium]
MNTTLDFGIFSLIPAGVTILAAVLTHRVALALFLGIVAGALTVKHAAFGAGLSACLQYLKLSFADGERLKISLFILLVGGLLELISRSGAYERFSEAISRKLDSARKTRVATFLLSLCVFFDDYANVLICGASMRTLCPKHRISPALLAYIVDQTAVIVSVVLISTWAGFEASLLVSSAEPLGVKISSSALFLGSMPYHVVTFLGLLLACLSAWTGTWIGARLDDGPPAASVRPPTPPRPETRLRHLFVPLGGLVVFAVAGLAGFTLRNIVSSWDSGLSLITVFSDLPTVDILNASVSIALAGGILLFRRDGVLAWREIAGGLWKGMKSLIPTGLVIILAKGLSAVSTDLGTGLWLTSLLGDRLSPALIPVAAMGVSFLITVATGFSWSSMAIVMPIGFQMALSAGGESLIPIVAGAVISGSIAGGLIIPYSDTTVITAAGFGIPPLYHAKTQALQILPLIPVAALAYGLLGSGFGIIVTYLVSAPLVVLLHLLVSRASIVFDEK